MRILMVCLGNICRSPIAEGVLQHLAIQHGLKWTVHSAGTNSYHTGEPPHRFSQKICKVHGIDISHQRARTFIPADLNKYDKIYAFAGDVYRNIQKACGANADMSKVDYFLNELKPGSNDSVPDPWYGAEDGYTEVFDLIERTCKAIIEKHKRNNE